MPETNTIKYGGDDLNLTASETLVAVPNEVAGQAPAAVPAVAAAMAETEAAEEVTQLGPFRILSVASAPQNAEATVRRFNAATPNSPNNQNATRVYHTSDDGVPFVPSGEIYLEFEDDVADEWINVLLQEHELEVLKESGERGVVVRSGQDAVQLCVELQGIDGVTVAEPELITAGQLRQIPNDALLNEQWHLENTGQINGNGIGLTAGADARVVAAWQKLGQAGSPSVVVAVIDDGFDLGHPDLGPSTRIVAPYNFEHDNTDPSPRFNGPNSLNQPFGGDWHGTACAGVAIGRADGDGIVGAAPNSRFMPLRWSPFITDSYIESAFGYAKDNGADVVSCSWGVAANVFRLSTRMKNAIADCAQNGRDGRGCVICFAAGNSNHDINNPPFSLDGFAIHPDVIAIAASTSVDTKSHYSSFGDEVSICAPSSGNGGRGVLTADVRGYYTFQGTQYFSGYSPSEFTKYNTSYLFGGTSSSCPLVAGICALMLSVDPTLTSSQVKQILESTARKIGGATGFSIYFGHGCVDAEAAIDEVLSRMNPKDTKVNPKSKTRRAKNGKLVGSAQA